MARQLTLIHFVTATLVCCCVAGLTMVLTAIAIQLFADSLPQSAKVATVAATAAVAAGLASWMAQPGIARRVAEFGRQTKASDKV